MRELVGSLVQVKQNDRHTIYDIKVPVEGLRGSIFIQRGYPFVFDKLILIKKENEDGRIDKG